MLKSAREFSKCNATHIELKLFVVKLKIGLYLIKRFRNEISNNAGKLARFIKEPDITGFYACKFTLTKKKFSCFGILSKSKELMQTHVKTANKSKADVILCNPDYSMLLYEYTYPFLESNNW